MALPAPAIPVAIAIAIAAMAGQGFRLEPDHFEEITQRFQTAAAGQRGQIARDRLAT